MGLRCIIPPRYLSQIKTRAIPLTYVQSGQELCRPWYIFYGICIETPLHNLFSNIKVVIWHPAVGLRCIIPPRHLSQLKTRAIPLTYAQSGQELCRPWYIFYGIFIETPLHNLFSNIKIDIWHPPVGLMCIIPPRHLSQIKTQAIPLT